MSNITIYFGEMGCGKSYRGKRLAEDCGYYFYEGDDAVLPEMAERVSQFKPLDRNMILQFVNQLCATLIEKAERHDNLVVAQALYCDEDRRYINNILSMLGHNVTWKWVKTPFWQNMKQIYSRPKGFRWVLYWLMNKPFFQKPTHEYKTV